MTAASILGIIFGMKIESEDDLYVGLVEKVMHSMAVATNPGSYVGE